MRHTSACAWRAVRVAQPGCVVTPVGREVATCMPAGGQWLGKCYEPVMSITVLPVVSDPAAPPLVDDLQAAGLQSLPLTQCSMMVRDALRQSPDVVVCWEARPGPAFVAALDALAATQPLPVIVFTQDASAESAGRALQAGVQEWVVQGYARERLRPLVQLARLRFERERERQQALETLQQRLEERKLVDRAKGILMRAGQLSEDEAFRLLRNASMHANRRVGHVSQQVIDGALYGEAVNRAGQLRMLSQRVVMLRALVLADVDAAAAHSLLAVSAARAEANLAALERLLSPASFGDLLIGLKAAWQALAAGLAAPATLAGLPALDGLAERCLERGDHLVAALEAAGLAGTLHVINLCGRQRMRGQRLAKQWLLGELLAGEDGAQARAAATQTAHEFEQALAGLRALPLSTPEIGAGLDRAAQDWAALLQGQQRLQRAEGRRMLAASSEALLERFEDLTERYERSMQLLIG